MAQLKDLLVNGASRLIGDAFVNKIQITTISAPTSSGGTTYGPGTSGQVLKSNGSSVYWTSLGGAAGYGVTDSSSASAIGTGTSLTTERDVYYGLPTINNSHAYTSNTTIYAPTAGGTANYVLWGNGTTSAPIWKAPKDALNYLINSLDTGSSNLTSNDYVITQYVGGGTTTTTYHRRPASAIRVGGLLTARKLKVALGSTTDVTFDGTGDQTSIPVSGTLAVGNGGTGQTSIADIKAGKDADGNTISSTYLKLAGGTMTGRLIENKGLSMSLIGSATAGVNNSGTYTPVKWTYNAEITVADGDIVTVKVPTNGTTNGDYGVFMSLNNGTNYYPIVLSGTSRLTTQYSVGSYITCIFQSDGSAANMFPLAGGTGRTTVSGGVFRVINYYDSGNSGLYQQYTAKAYKVGSTATTAYDLLAENINGYLVPAHSVAHRVGCPIYIRDGALAANATGSWTGLYYSHYSFTIRKGGTNLSLTTYAPVFLKGTISEGVFTPDTTTPYVSGKANCNVSGAYYMYVGDATGSTTIALQEVHPYYYYNGTNLVSYIEYADAAASAQSAASVPWSGITSKPSTSIAWGAGTTAGPTLTVTAAGSSSSAVAIPAASESASGIVTTGGQQFMGNKGFGYISRFGYTNTGALTSRVGVTQWRIANQNDRAQVAESYYDIGNSTTVVKGQFVWKQGSPNTTPDGQTTGYYEIYSLPNVDSGLSADVNYTILTTKNAIAEVGIEIIRL